MAECSNYRAQGRFMQKLGAQFYDKSKHFLSYQFRKAAVLDKQITLWKSSFFVIFWSLLVQ